MADVEFRQQTGPRLPMLILYILAALLIAVIIVFGSRWVYHKVHKNNAATITQNTNNKTPLAPSGSAKKTAKSSHKKSSSSRHNNHSTLADTGPGDVAALFLGTSAAAAGLHYIISARRAKI